MQNLPYTERGKRENREPGKVLHTVVCGGWGKSVRKQTFGGKRHSVLLVEVKRVSRFLRYSISSTISFTTPSSFRISVSRLDSDSWFAMALAHISISTCNTRPTRTPTCSRQHQRQYPRPNPRRSPAWKQHSTTHLQ